MPLAVNLLQNELTLVGTVKENKTFVPANFFLSSRREVNSSTFDFQRNMTLTSYVSKKNKALLILSSMHYDAEVTDDDIRKPNINLFYNQTKGEVDTLDQVVYSYMSRKKQELATMLFSKSS